MSLLPDRAILAASPDRATTQAFLLSLLDFLGQRLERTASGVGTATGAELALARASLGVGAQGLKNRIINGGGRVQSRAAPTISASVQYGAADRMRIAAFSGSGFSGTAGVLANSGFSTGIGYGAVAASWTSGIFCVQQLLETKNVSDLNGKTITISCRVYQDTGSSRNFFIQLLKPTVADNHASQTLIGTSGTTACASGAATTVTATFVLGASDATNGLAVAVYDNAASTISNKNMAVGDLQLEEGAVATAFEVRPIGLELQLCERYYEPITAFQFTGYNTAGNNIGGPVFFRTSKRVVPTVAGTFGYFNASGGSFASISVNGIAFAFAVITATGNAVFNITNASADAEIN